MLDADRSEQRVDCKLIVWLAGHRFADECGVSQGVRGITAAGPRIESKLRCALVAVVSKDVFPRTIVWCARGFGTDARCVIEQLLDSDLRLARVAQWLRPRDEVEGRVVELHF